MINVEYDCIRWSVDKNRSALYEWYPESPSISRLPDNYTVSPDNATLLHKGTGMPIIEYSDNEFRIQENIMDWEMYICLNQKQGFVTLKDGIEIRIGAVVSAGQGRHLAVIRGKATIVYHDSIWSESSIEAEGVTLKGYEDTAHRHLSFIYCDNFTGTDIRVEGVNRIYGKGSVRLKNAVICDEADESKYVYDILNRELMPGMYLHAGMSFTAESCDIDIHNYIEAYYVTFINSRVTVRNLLSANPAVSSSNRMVLKNTSLAAGRGELLHIGQPSAVISVKDGNLILMEQSELTVTNENYEVKNYACIFLGEGHICISDSKLMTTKYPRAINMFSYGGGVVNPSGAEVHMNFSFVPQQTYQDYYRFKTELDGYTMWIYAKGRTVTKVECIEAEADLESFDAQAFKNYVTAVFSRILPEPGRLQYRALISAAPVHDDKPTFCIEGE